MKSHTIVVSVGTSLLNNLLHTNTPMAEVLKIERGRDLERTADDIRWFLDDPERNGAEELAASAQAWPAFIRKLSFDSYVDYFDDARIAANVENRKKREMDRLPAEISTLFLYYHDADGNLRERFEGRRSDSEQTRRGDRVAFAEKDRIVFLCTDTADSVFCAAVLRKMVENSSWFHAKCDILKKEILPEKYRDAMLDSDGIKFISGLDVHHPEQWAGRLDQSNEAKLEETGIGRMLSWFLSLKNLKLILQGDVVLRTGGYKEMSAELKMIAMQFKMKSCYLFEKSVVLVETYTGRWPKDYTHVPPNSGRLN